MSSPNLLTANLILGKTSGTLLSSASYTSILDNASSSNKTLKINTINLSNQGSTTQTAIVKYFTQASLGGTGYVLAANLAVPPSSTLTLVDKGTQYYLEENTSIGGLASTDNAIIVTVSYEDIS
jgi:hypothetical protein